MQITWQHLTQDRLPALQLLLQLLLLLSQAQATPGKAMVQVNFCLASCQCCNFVLLLLPRVVAPTRGGCPTPCLCFQEPWHVLSSTAVALCCMQHRSTLMADPFNYWWCFICSETVCLLVFVAQPCCGCGCWQGMCSEWWLLQVVWVLHLRNLHLMPRGDFTCSSCCHLTGT